MKVKILFLLMFLCLPITANAFWTPSQEEIEKQKLLDEHRISDLHFLAEKAQKYYDINGYYPLADGNFEMPLVVVITDKNYPPRGPTVDKSQLEKAFKEVFGGDFEVPMDPQVGEERAPRLYQYSTNGMMFTVSAFLFFENEFTTKVATYSNKYEVGSLTVLKLNILKLRDIEYIKKNGFDDHDLSKQLMQAVQNSDFDAAKKSLADGANPTPLCGFNHRCQPLTYAAENADIPIMKLLIDKGADVNGTNGYYDTPLIYALGTEFPNFEVIKLLVDSGADVNQPNAFGISPFLGQCIGGNIELFHYFVKNGADINAAFYNVTSLGDNTKNFTCLMAAAYNNQDEIVGELLRIGVDKNVETPEGKTALDLAIEKGHKKITSLLENN